MLILGILGSMGLSVYAFSDDANQLIETLPEATQKLRDTMRRRSSDSSVYHHTHTDALRRYGKLV